MFEGQPDDLPAELVHRPGATCAPLQEMVHLRSRPGPDQSGFRLTCGREGHLHLHCPPCPRPSAAPAHGQGDRPAAGPTALRSHSPDDLERLPHIEVGQARRVEVPGLAIFPAERQVGEDGKRDPILKADDRPLNVLVQLQELGRPAPQAGQLGEQRPVDRGANAKGKDSRLAQVASHLIQRPLLGRDRAVGHKDDIAHPFRVGRQRQGCFERRHNFGAAPAVHSRQVSIGRVNLGLGDRTGL